MRTDFSGNGPNFRLNSRSVNDAASGLFANVERKVQAGGKLQFTDSGSERRYIDANALNVLFYIVGEASDVEKRDTVGAAPMYMGSLYAVYMAIFSGQNIAESMRWMSEVELMTEVEKIKQSKQFNNVATLNFAVYHTNHMSYVRAIVDGGIPKLKTLNGNVCLDREVGIFLSNLVKGLGNVPNNSEMMYESMSNAIANNPELTQKPTITGNNERATARRDTQQNLTQGQLQKETQEKLTQEQARKITQERLNSEKVTVTPADMALFTFKQTGETRTIRLVQPLNLGKQEVLNCFRCQSIPGNMVFNIYNASKLPGKKVEYTDSTSPRRIISMNKNYALVYVIGEVETEKGPLYVVYMGVSNHGTMRESVGVYSWQNLQVLMDKLYDQKYKEHKYDEVTQINFAFVRGKDEERSTPTFIAERTVGMRSLKGKFRKLKVGEK